jgi:hypothetical protein
VQRTLTAAIANEPQKCLRINWFWTYIGTQHCRRARACLPTSRYANASSSALASWRSAVSKPSVNQP